MTAQLSPEDLDRLLAEEAMIGDARAISFLKEVLGEEGVEHVVEWCASWAYEVLGPKEEGSRITNFTSKELISAMAAMGLGLFELGWKAHVQYGRNG